MTTKPKVKKTQAKCSVTNPKIKKTQAKCTATKPKVKKTKAKCRATTQNLKNTRTAGTAGTYTGDAKPGTIDSGHAIAVSGNTQGAGTSVTAQFVSEISIFD